MPKELEMKLMAEAKKRHMKKEKENAYVYGTMRKMGWRPMREKKNG